MKAIAVLTTVVVIFCAGCTGNKSATMAAVIIPDTIPSNLSYGPESRQWLNIYQAPSPVPTPIYIWAHANNHTASDTREFVEYLKAEGISTISWESLPRIRSPGAAEIIWADAKLMFQWVKDNAGKYNMNADNPKKIIHSIPYEALYDYIVDFCKSVL